MGAIDAGIQNGHGHATARRIGQLSMHFRDMDAIEAPRIEFLWRGVGRLNGNAVICRADRVVEHAHHIGIVEQDLQHTADKTEGDFDGQGVDQRQDMNDLNP